MHQNSYKVRLKLTQSPRTRRAIIFCSFNGTLPSYLRSKCTIDYTLYDFVAHPIFLIVTKIWNRSTRGQTFVHIETDITVLVVTLLNFIIKPSAFSDTCKSYPFLCNGSKKVTVTWLLRCKYYMAIASSQARQDYAHNFSADQA